MLNYIKSGDNYCVTAFQQNLPETNWAAGDASRVACMLQCDAKPECTAIEWYDSGWDGSKCKLMLDKIPAATHKSGNRWKDTECFIKKTVFQGKINV